ncbi:MAG: F0F1 ATP synthase subunit epsilon [Paludibacteraceae bacterium]|nr:F0F1 ATP synthase subunit epsilon [Paludibacteraceae bacterium]
MKFVLLSPQKKLFEGDVDSVTVPGELGSFTIWPKHAALISTLKDGDLICRRGNDELARFRVDGGFVEVRNDSVSVCVERVLSDKSEE